MKESKQMVSNSKNNNRLSLANDDEQSENESQLA